MNALPKSDELHLALNSRYEELVRAFARESLLAEACHSAVASSVAESTLVFGDSYAWAFDTSQERFIENNMSRAMLQPPFFPNITARL